MNNNQACRFETKS